MDLIATIGTGNYSATSYYLAGDSEKEYESCYCPAAMVRLLPGVKRIWLLLTDKAKEKHFPHLKEELAAIDVEIRELLIPMGKNEEELWKVTQVLMEAIPADIEIALDMTHSFRHLPVMMLLSLVFLESARGATIRGIHYGAFEAKDDKGRTPIFDLLPVLQLLESYHAARQFRETGDARRLAYYLKQLNASDWGQQKGSKAFTILTRGLESLGHSLVTPLPLEAGLHARHVLDSIADAMDRKLTAPVDSLLKMICQHADTIATPKEFRKKSGIPLSLDELRRQFRFIQFAFDSQAYDRALLLLREWIISRCLLANDQTSQWLDYSLVRHPVESALNLLSRRLQSGDPLVSKDERELSSLWERVGERRNSLAHSGMRPEMINPAREKEAIWKLMDECKSKMAENCHWKIEENGMDSYTTVIYSIGVEDPITPEAPLPPLPAIPRGALVVVEGRAPIWRYGMAMHRLHGSPATAIAFYDPRLGAVVVASHSPKFQEGMVLEITIPESSTEASS